MRRYVIILILIFIMSGLTSCYDANEIDDFLHVATIGVDKGVSDKWRLTVQYPTLQEPGARNDSGGGSTGQGEYLYATIDAPSFFTGVKMLNTSLPRRLAFIHTQIIVISEELAKSGLICEYIAPISRSREIRKSAHVLVVKGKAGEFLRKNQPVIGSMLSKSFQMLVNESVNTGFFPHVTFGDFCKGFKSPTHQSVAILAAVNKFRAYEEDGEPWGTKFKTGGNYTAGELPRKGGNKIELFGTALFDGNTMVGKLAGDETRYMLMARGEYKRSFFTIPDPKEPELIVSLNVIGSKEPEIKISLNDGKRPMIHLKINLDGVLLAVQSRIDYEKPERKALLEETFSNHVKKETEKVIKKCQDLNVDVFHFGDLAAKQFLTIKELEDYNWHSHFKDAKITVDVAFTIRNTCTKIKNNPIWDSKGVH